jgi:hypothetical protein
MFRRLPTPRVRAAPGFATTAKASMTSSGAIGDVAANDRPAIQSTIDFCASLSGGTVFFSQGGYLIDSALFVNAARIRLEGCGQKYCSVQSTTPNTTMIAISATSCAVKNLSIFQAVLSSSQSALIFMGSGAVQCLLSDLNLVGGWNCILFAAGSVNNTVRDVVATFTSGGQIVDIQGGQFVSIHDCVFDQGWPNDPSPPPVASQFKGTRHDNTAYSVGDVVTVSGVYLQCRVGGTSGTGAPALSYYLIDIPDGTTLKWRLANVISSCALRVDSGAYRIRITDTDHTGAYDNGIVVSNSLGSSSPYEIMISRCESSGIINNSVALLSGNRITISDCEFNAPCGTASTKAAVFTQSGFAGDLVVNGCRAASGFDIGILLSGGTNNVVTNNRLFATTGVRVAANITKFAIMGNAFASATWGAATTGIMIDAGTSDYFNVTNNIVSGVATPINGGGSATHATISGNN